MSKSISAKNENLVSALTSYLRGLANRRSAGSVTADDAQKFLTNKGVSPKMIRTRQAVINSALMSGEFEAGDMVPSSRPAAKGRQITEWYLA